MIGAAVMMGVPELMGATVLGASKSLEAPWMGEVYAVIVDEGDVVGAGDVDVMIWV